MKESIYKTYDELPLFLNAGTVAKVLGVSPSSGYELMHEQGCPFLSSVGFMVNSSCSKVRYCSAAP